MLRPEGSVEGRPAKYFLLLQYDKSRNCKFFSIAQEVIQLQEASTAQLSRILAFWHRLVLRIFTTKLNEGVELFATLSVRDGSRHAERGESARQEASIVRCASAPHRQVAPESLRVHTATVAMRRCRCLLHGSTRQRRQVNDAWFRGRRALLDALFRLILRAVLVLRRVRRLRSDENISFRTQMLVYGDSDKKYRKLTCRRLCFGNRIQIRTHSQGVGILDTQGNTGKSTPYM